jgi:16S rRNA (guanine966-N2)-methyltransferase
MLRIVGGRLGGRRIGAPKGEATRPTAEKVRGALFNMLANLMDLEGARVLDLYAGSGALGLEALSRGAAHVTFVESNARTAALIRANLAALEIEAGAASVVTARVLAWLGREATGLPAHLILADPPYAAGECDPLLAALADWPGAASGAWIAVEAPARLEPRLPGRLELTRVKRYGDTQLLICRKGGGGQASSANDSADRMM